MFSCLRKKHSKVNLAGTNNDNNAASYWKPYFYTADDYALIHSGTPEAQVCQSYPGNVLTHAINDNADYPGCGPDAWCCAPDPCGNVDCGANGTCSDGKCVCTNGYTGANCQKPPGPANWKPYSYTPTDLSMISSGTPEGQVCQSHPGNEFTQAVDGNADYPGCGAEAWCCAPDLCVDVDCGANGTCSNGKCICAKGYTGANCQTPAAATYWKAYSYTPDDLSMMGSGTPEAQVCQSHPGNAFTQGANGNADYPGCDAAAWCCAPDPSNPCANVDCGANGTCSSGQCVCTNGYTGANCQTPPDVSNWKPYSYTAADLSMMNSGTPEVQVCQSHPGNAYTRAANGNVDYPGCDADAWCCAPDVANWKPYSYTAADLSMMNSGTPEGQVCQSHPGNAYTRAANGNADYPGCDADAWCCAPAS